MVLPSQLGKFGVQAKQAVPGIMEALDDPVPFVRRAAVTALKQIDPAIE